MTKHFDKACSDAFKTVKRQANEIEKLRKQRDALLKYASHTDKCLEEPVNCICGFFELINEIEADK